MIIPKIPQNPRPAKQIWKSYWTNCKTRDGKREPRPPGSAEYAAPEQMRGDL